MQVVAEIAKAIIMTAGAIFVLTITVLGLFATIAGIQAVIEEDKKRKGKKK